MGYLDTEDNVTEAIWEALQGRISRMIDLKIEERKQVVKSICMIMQLISWISFLTTWTLANSLVRLETKFVIVIQYASISIDM